MTDWPDNPVIADVSSKTPAAKPSVSEWPDHPVVGESGGTPAEQFASKIPMRPARMEFMGGATLGFEDELQAAGAAGATAVGNVIDYATGRKPKVSPGEAYDAVLDRSRNVSARFEEQKPWEAVGLNLAGGLMAPGGEKAAKFISGGGALNRALVRAPLVGATYGAVSGFGSGQGDILNRLTHAAWGLPFGALTALGFQGGAEAVAAAAPIVKMTAKVLGNHFEDAFKMLSGKSYDTAVKSFTPDQLAGYKEMAINYVKELIQRSGKTPKDLIEDPAFKMGKPITGAEVIGRIAINQQASLARRAGTAPDLVESQLRQRLETTPQRVLEDAARAASVNPAATQPTMDELGADLRKKAAPLYEAAYSGPAPVLKDNPKLVELMERPSVKKALGRAVELAAEEGVKPEELGLEVRHVRKFIGQDANNKPVYMNVPEEVSVKNPTMKTWDYVKRGLQAVINREHKDITGKLITDESSRAVIGTLKELRSELFRINPTYEQAVAAGGEPLQLEAAYRDAAKLMGSNVPESAFLKNIKNYTPAQLEALKGGWVNSIFDGVRSGKLKLKDLKSDAFLGKAERLLGVSQARELVARVEQEQRLLANANRMMPGRQSITAELIEAGGETDEMTNDLHNALRTTIRRGPRKGLEDFVMDNVFRLWREVKTPEKIGLRNQISELLRMRPDQLLDLLQQPMEKTAKTPVMNLLLRAFGSAPLGQAAGQQQSVGTAPQ